MEPHFQQEAYYSVFRGFTGRHKLRRLRLLGVGYAEAAAWYVVMHDISSSASTFGEFSTDVRSFVDACGGIALQDRENDAKLAGIWRKFEAVGLVRLEGDPEGVDELGLPSVFRVRVLDADEVNRPRKPAMSSTERSRKWRDKKRDERNDGDENSVPGDDPNVAGDGGGTGDAEPTNQPTNQLRDIETPPLTPPSISPTNETKGTQERPGEVGEAKQETPTDFTQAQKNRTELNRLKRELGRHSTPIMELVSVRNDTRRNPLSQKEELAEYWRPLYQLREDHGEMRFAFALGQAAQNNPTYATAYIKKILETEVPKRDDRHLKPVDDFSDLEDWGTIA